METMRTDKVLFPDPVSDLLHTLSSVGFFRESMLIGSWVMTLYSEFFGISYVLRTMDIDFAVQLLHKAKSPKRNLQDIIVSKGFTAFFTQSGLQKFSREGFTIEFITHRRGGRDEDPVLLSNWNVTAMPLPFVNILTSFPFVAQCTGCEIRAPIPEAFFLHKLITAARRPEEAKRSKDLEQCAVIAPRLDQRRLDDVRSSVKLGSHTWDSVRSSCEAIHFPPQLLGIERQRSGKTGKHG
jgi:hypothetical protein